MAENFEHFNGFKEDFNKKHGVNFDFDSYAKETRRFRGIMGHMSITGSTAPENIIYRNFLLNLFREATQNRFESRVTKPLDAVAFYQDFDKLIDHYRQHCKENNQTPPTANGGWKESEAIDAMQEKVKDYLPDKADYIVKQYLERKIRLRDIRADLDKIKKTEPLTPEDLSRVMVYTRALQKVKNMHYEQREKQTFIGRALGYFRLRAEKRELKSCDTFLQESKQKIGMQKYEQTGALADADIITGVRSDLTNAKEAAVARELEIEAEAKLTNKDRATKLLQNEELQKKVANEIGDMIKDSKISKTIKDLAINFIQTTSFDRIKDMWDKAGAKGDEMSEADMKEEVAFLLSSVNQNLRMITDMSEKDRFINSQKITDMVLKQFSPIAYNDKYAKFADNYFIKEADNDLVQDRILFKGDINEFMNEVREEFTSNKVKFTVSLGEPEPSVFSPKVNSNDSPVKENNKSF